MIDFPPEDLLPLENKGEVRCPEKLGIIIWEGCAVAFNIVVVRCLVEIKNVYYYR